MSNRETDILVVGGGAAGMSAALAAVENAEMNVMVIDDNPRLGGQIWRAELGRTKSRDAAKLIAAIDASRIEVMNDAQIFAVIGDNRLAAETPSGRVEFNFEKLIIATGARERFLPFPGWTLPNVFGTGGLQALVKGGLNIDNKRIVVAGTGPLLLAVADYLKSKGGHVLAIVEQTRAVKLRRFARSLWREPNKLVEAAALRARLIGVPYLTGSWVTAVAHPNAPGGSTKNALEVNISRNGRLMRLECDFLTCGFHLVPNTELAALMGCNIADDCVVVDEFQQTSLASVFCAGEPTGIGGVEASVVEGKIAGYSAIGEKTKARKLFSKRTSTRRFAVVLNSAFTLRKELRSLPNDDSIVCRCEDVTLGSLKTCSSRREAKLQTRCGMGACQGRICGPATEFLFGWEADTVRPPIFPVKLESL